MGLLRVRQQRLAHALHQQTVAPVGAHGEGQGALQHVLQRSFISAQRQGQVARVKVNRRAVGVERGATRKQHRISRLVCRWGKRKLGRL